MRKEVNLELEIGNAIQLRGLEIFAQPIVDLRPVSTNLPHFEILSRFIDQNGKVINAERIFEVKRPPHVFEELDKIIFDTAFNALNQMWQSLGEKYTAAINVTNGSIQNRDGFAEYFRN